MVKTCQVVNKKSYLVIEFYEFSAFSAQKKSKRVFSTNSRKVHHLIATRMVGIRIEFFFSFFKLEGVLFTINVSWFWLFIIINFQGDNFLCLSRFLLLQTLILFSCQNFHYPFAFSVIQTLKSLNYITLSALFVT